MLFSFRQFFWRGFLFCVLAAALLFFFLHFKKNKCAASAVAIKTMTKNCLQHRTPPLYFGGVSRAVAWACLALLAAAVYIQLLGFALIQTDDVL